MDNIIIFYADFPSLMPFTNSTYDNNRAEGKILHIQVDYVSTCAVACVSAECSMASFFKAVLTLYLAKELGHEEMIDVRKDEGEGNNLWVFQICLDTVSGQYIGHYLSMLLLARKVLVGNDKLLVACKLTFLAARGILAHLHYRLSSVPERVLARKTKMRCRYPCHSGPIPIHSVFEKYVRWCTFMVFSPIDHHHLMSL